MVPIVPLRLVLLCVRFYRGMSAHAEGGESIYNVRPHHLGKVMGTNILCPQMR